MVHNTGEKTPSLERKSLGIILALCCAVLAVYLQTATFDFTRYDDNYFITENSVVQQGLTLDNFFWALTAVQNGTWQPVTWLTHMFDCHVFGLNAGGHHIVNVIFHLVSTGLLFTLLLRLTNAYYPSAFVAGLFALHPLHVESVAWVGERRDVLSTIWWLLTMSTYSTWVFKRGFIRYALVVLCFALGLMSKPMLVSLPLILLLIDVWPLKRVLGEEGLVNTLAPSQYGRLVVEKIPLFVLAAGMSLITMIAVGQEGSLGSSIQYPWSFRVENAIVTYVKYLQFTIWPAGLIPHYPYPAYYPLWQVAGSLLILALITLYCLKEITRQPYLGVGWFWYLLSMFPVIGLVQQGSGFSMADRYTYVPLIGIFIMIAWSAKRLTEQYRWAKSYVPWMSALLTLVCGILSFMQTRHWRDTETLFAYTLAQSPGNHIALQQLGVEYRERGDLARAYEFLAEDVRLNPGDIDALANFGQLLEKMGRLIEAVAYHQKAIVLNPSNPEIHLNLGQIQARLGDLAGAQTSFSRVLALQPDSVPARLNLGYTLFLAKEYNAAAAQFASVLKKAPQMAEAYNGLGLVAMEQGRLGDAADSFRTALRLKPELQHARDNLKLIEHQREKQ